MRTYALFATLLLAAGAWASEPVKLVAYPQKVRTFYCLNDPAAPAALCSAPPALPTGEITALARASDAALWLGSTQGLTRVAFSGPEPDRCQYFAGRRYLPDDQVQHLVPDACGGVWVRTRTGVAHIELRPMTLAQKADRFEARIRARHDRYGLVADCRLPKAGETFELRAGRQR